MSIPTTQRAIKTDGNDKASVHTDVPIPDIPPGYLLVKTTYVALNPTDWKSISRVATPGRTAGCDYAGTVVSIGPGVTKSWRPGDRIAGFTHGCKSNNPQSGAFAQYIIVKGDVQLRTPASVSDKEAATMGVGLATIAQGMYQNLGLPWPNNPTSDKTPLLIYGGSTATGIFAIQFAKLSGLTVVTTCSPRNFEFVKELGADAAFDYSEPEKCAAAIRAYTNNSLLHAYDCIGTGSAPEICANALTSASGAKYCSVSPFGKLPRSDVALDTWHLAYTTLGEAFEFPPGGGKEMAAKPEDWEYAVRFIGVAEGLLGEGAFRGNPKLREGGLDGVLEGLQELRDGRVSGQKLVYKVD